MPGTKAGWEKARANYPQYFTKEWFAKIGRKGGKVGRTGGFASDVKGKDGLTGRERAAVVGKKGGYISRRGVRV